ncbi:hypothetical protein Hypma_007017 [Hypsizygus marmoreus]|uniref:Uncharacterized protein n=1 Tax=Hypsizygus marmoreus TaxID=39966 RepID=A0A369KC90_HYPMA|nr:hypothetical protein Hypma_007017 [Hypsizygus marmoreus]
MTQVHYFSPTQCSPGSATVFQAILAPDPSRSRKLPISSLSGHLSPPLPAAPITHTRRPRDRRSRRTVGFFPIRYTLRRRWSARADVS